MEHYYRLLCDIVKAKFGKSVFTLLDLKQELHEQELQQKPKK
jgi:hypothetical protein